MFGAFLFRWNRYHITYVLYILFLLNVFTFKQLTVNEEMESDDVESVVVKRIDRSVLRPLDMKKILLWNPWYGDFGFALDDDFAFARVGCEVSNCIMTKNKNLVKPEEADAVVFLYTNLCELPKVHNRQGFQRYVLLTDDAPMCYPRNYFERDNLFGSFFNWTISYRENADIKWKRGWVEKLTVPTKKNSLQQVKFRNSRKKKKLVGWYVARCGSKSKREGYINELKEYIPVDSYGPCGNLTCPETNGSPGEALQPCLDMLADNYKFVLAFERFLCDDFVTKRFFDILSRDTIPIVFGGADYTRLAPPHSFIDALTFTPKQLADRLLELDQNEKLYYRHFWWKDFYQVHSGYQEISTRPFCELCDKLNSNLPRKIYRDIDAWWYNSTKCSQPEELGVVIRNKGNEDLHSIQIPWSLDD